MSAPQKESHVSSKCQGRVKETIISRLSVLCCTLPATPFVNVSLVPVYSMLFNLSVRLF